MRNAVERRVVSTPAWIVVGFVVLVAIIVALYNLLRVRRPPEGGA